MLRFRMSHMGPLARGSMGSLLKPVSADSANILKNLGTRSLCAMPEPPLDDNGDITRNFIEEHQISVKGLDLNDIQPVMDFKASSPFSTKLKNILLKEGFDAPTAIQSISWPIVSQRHDVISVAKTGSGKTLGFLLPAFQNILTNQGIEKTGPKKLQKRGMLRYDGRSNYKPPTVLVLAPTRELTMQIASESEKYSKVGIDTAVVYGGSPKGPQIFKLRRGVDVVVATPGRCNDLAEMGALDLSKIEYLVLDEADRMLDMGFEPQIREIVDQLPTHAHRQTLFFTATWPKEVQVLAHEFLNEPVQINVGDNKTLNANKAISQRIKAVKEFQKEEVLFDILAEEINISENPQALPKTIIFVGRKSSADELQYSLRRAGYRAAALHGDKSQAVRTDTMDKFRRGRISVLVATDVAARGLDVKDIEYVINFDFPEGGAGAVEDYVHRIGRTARGNNAQGTAYTFLNASNLSNYRGMKELQGVLQRCEQEVPPEVAKAADQFDARFHHGGRSRYDNNNNNRGGARHRDNRYNNSYNNNNRNNGHNFTRGADRYSNNNDRYGRNDWGDNGRGRGGGGRGGAGRGMRQQRGGSDWGEYEDSENRFGLSAGSGSGRDYNDYYESDRNVHPRQKHSGRSRDRDYEGGGRGRGLRNASSNRSSYPDDFGFYYEDNDRTNANAATATTTTAPRKNASEKMINHLDGILYDEDTLANVRHSTHQPPQSTRAIDNFDDIDIVEFDSSPRSTAVGIPRKGR